MEPNKYKRGDIPSIQYSSMKNSNIKKNADIYIPNNCLLNINSDRLKRNIINININNRIKSELGEKTLSNEPIKYSFKVKNDTINKITISNISKRYGPLYFLYQLEENVIDSFFIFLSINN